MQAAVSCVHIAKRLNAKRVQLHTCRLSVHVNVAESLALRIGKHVRPRALCVLNHPVADQGEIMSKRMCCGRVTVTVTEALVLRPPPTRRPRAHHRVSPYLGARRQNETEMFPDHDETSPLIAAADRGSCVWKCPILDLLVIYNGRRSTVGIFRTN